MHKGKLIFATVGDRTDHSLTVVQPTSPPRPRVVGFGDFEFSGELSRFVGGWKGEDANIVVADLERESLRIVAVPAYMRFKASFGLAALRVLSNARATYLFGSKGVARVDGATGQVKMAQLPFSLLDQLDELNEQLYEGEPREWARGSSLWFFAEDHCYCVNEKTLDVRAKF